MALDHYLQPVCSDILLDPNGPLSSSFTKTEKAEAKKEAIPESSLPNDPIFSHNCHTLTVVTSISPLPCNWVFSQHYHIAQQVHLCLQSSLPPCCGTDTPVSVAMKCSHCQLSMYMIAGRNIICIVHCTRLIHSNVLSVHATGSSVKFITCEMFTFW